MKESIPSRAHPPHAAQKPRIWFLVRGTFGLRESEKSAAILVPICGVYSRQRCGKQNKCIYDTNISCRHASMIPVCVLKLKSDCMRKRWKFPAIGVLTEFVCGVDLSPRHGYRQCLVI